jgi:hypothetical protein
VYTNQSQNTEDQKIRGSGMSDGNTYDYIIVGAGSAGCVLAGRLTEDSDAKVLILEAGGSDKNPLIQIPLGMGKMHEHRMHDWGFDAEPEESVNGREVEAMRGKVIGGSSSINVMAYPMLTSFPICGAAKIGREKRTPIVAKAARSPPNGPRTTTRCWMTGNRPVSMRVTS